MLDRTIQPQSEPLQFVLPEYEKIMLDNKMPCYIVNNSTEDVVKIEMTFPAGEAYGQNPMVAIAANRMLEEGTFSRTSKQIADELDFYGAYLSLNAEKDYASITLYGLSEHLSNILPIFQDLVLHTIFPENELAIYLNNSKQNFMVNLEKVSVLSKRMFMELTYGKDHPYGRNVELEHYSDTNRALVLDFFKTYYQIADANLFVSGNMNAQARKVLNETFGQLDISKNNLVQKSVDFTLHTSMADTFFIPKKDAVQSSIRIGKATINRKHVDYASLQLLNTILGGYFGSRLMNNIREDKGYTYGIGSHLVSLQQAGFFSIATEVGCAVTEATLFEIKKELSILCDTYIDQEEIEKVRNYMLGSLLRSFDGPFEISDRLKTCVLNNLDFSWYQQYVDKLTNTSAIELNNLAINYLSPSTMIQVVAGQK